MIGLGLRHQMGEWLRLAMPALVCLMLLLISVAPWRPFDAPLGGFLVITAIFYWSIYQPEAMTPWVAAAIGLASDVLGLSPFGLSMIIALVVAGSAQLWRRELADASFLLVWMAFAATALAVFFISWTLAAVVMVQWPNPWPLVLQTVVNIALYPLLTLFYGRLQHALFE